MSQWCWTGSFCGFSHWPCWSERRGSSYKHQLFMMIGFQLTSNLQNYRQLLSSDALLSDQTNYSTFMVVTSMYVFYFIYFVGNWVDIAL